MDSKEFLALTNLIEFDSIIFAFMAVFAALVLVYVVRVGIKQVLRAVYSTQDSYYPPGHSYSYEYDDPTFKSIMRNQRRKGRRGY